MISVNNKSLNNIIIIVIIIFLLFLFKDWIRPKLITSLGGYVDKKTVTIRDTLPSIIDTIYLERDPINIDLVAFEKKVIEKYKHRIEKETISSNGRTKIEVIDEIKDSVYTFKTNITDTLITGSILTFIDPKDCNILSQNLEYTPKFPKFIKEFIPIEVKTTETLSNEKVPKIGFGITGNTLDMIGLKGLYQTKNDWQIQFGYEWTTNDLIINNEPVQGIIEIGIFKTF